MSRVAKPFVRLLATMMEDEVGKHFVSHQIIALALHINTSYVYLLILYYKSRVMESLV